MILRIELKETLSKYDKSSILIDVENKNITYIKKDSTILNNYININIEQLIYFINKHVIYWDSKYINNTIIDGNESELIISTSKEKFKYQFKNKYPHNYDEFSKIIKSVVNLI